MIAYEHPDGDDRYVHVATFLPEGAEPPHVSARSGGQGAAARRGKRKAARAARKRNRR